MTGRGLPQPMADLGGSAKSARRRGNSAARAAWDRALAAREAGDLSGARRWLERAHRIVPRDALVRLTLGALVAEMGEFGDAVALLEPVAHEYGSSAAWIALARCHLALGAEGPCVAALAGALQSSVLTPGLVALAERVVGRWGLPGWCGVDHDGRIRIEPAGAAEGAVVGSPLPVGTLMRVSGFVTEARGGISGWAWHPGDPDRDPLLLLQGPRGRFEITAPAVADGIEDLPPLARPRRFAVAAADVETVGRPVRVTDAWGNALLGSPLGGAQAAAPMTGPARVDLRARAVDVVVPVHGGMRETLACLDSVLASVPDSTVVHVVDDASPEPELVAAVDLLAQAGRIRLHRHTENRGFPASANIGLRAAAGRDVVLLNSDTLVAPGWLERLRRAAYAAAAIGSATPFSNDATIVSVAEGVVPDLAQTVALDWIAQAANAGQVAEIPVGVGFCLFLRRDCLEQVGPFREDVFGQGYGEENDFCLRAAQAGWRHVAALDVFVGHVGGRSFGAGRTHLRRRNQAILNRLHPGYDGLIARHVAADPLFEPRRRMAALRWAEGRQAGAVLLVTHAAGGGVAEMVAARAAFVRRGGQRAVVLHPVSGGCAIEGFADLRYAVPAELQALAALLGPDRPTRMEVHHMLGHHHALLGLATLLDVPTESWVHDAAHFCPRINLVGRSGRYCGEPDVAECERCVAALGSHLRERIGVRGLLARSAGELARSRRVVVATEDGARRLRRHFPALRPQIEAWEDAALPGLAPSGSGPVRIVIVGAIAVEKGYLVLLECAGDARERGLPIEFVVCGLTQDDERLMAAGPVFVTGRYAPSEAVALIRAQRADLAFVPSVCPESWCYGLSRAWQAGLEAVAFDLGAQAERIRATGRGAVLPLALPAAAVNDALLRLARRRGARQSPQP